MSTAVWLSTAVVKISRPLAHYVAVRNLCGERIVMSSPNESDFLMMMREHGQRVHQSSASPYLIQTAGRQEMHAYTELALAGRFDEAAAVSVRLDPLRKVSHRWIMSRWRETGVIPIAAIKEWSAMLGMAAGPVRTPLLQMDDGDRAAMRKDLEATGILAGELAAMA